MPGPGIDMTSLKRAPKHVGWEPQRAFANDQHFRMSSSPKNRWENDDDDDDMMMMMMMMRMRMRMMMMMMMMTMTMTMMMMMMMMMMACGKLLD